MQTHVKITAVLFMVFGGVMLVAAAFSSLVFGGIAALIGASGDEAAPIGAALMHFTGVALTVFLLLFSVPSIICGWGLLKYKPWARTLGIVLAAISLLRVPVGTAFGAYALWVLFSKQTEPLFDRRSVA